MSGTTYRECTFCVMDTSDPDITFDENGQCHHCRNFPKLYGTIWFPDDEGARRLASTVERLKAEGAGKDYDCVLGLSGGVDSSYLALKAYEWGLRPLVLHVDAGWNSELAVENIERLVKHCNFELHTHVVNWESMRDLQLAYLRAGVPNQDVPQDHAFFAGLYHFATANSIRYILNGGNIATEGIFPNAWHGSAMDSRNLLAIHERYGSQPLADYPVIGMWKYYFWYPVVRRMTPVRPLNYMPYSKELAIDELQSVGWREYPRKHGESLFTKWFQNYYLPKRFGYDKRRPHLSSRIAAGTLSRAEAKVLLEEPLYDPAELDRDTKYLCRKLRITYEELDELMRRPPGHHADYPNWDRRYAALKAVQQMGARATGLRNTVYS